MGNKLTKSSAILMTALTLGTSTLNTAQTVFAETGITKKSEAAVPADAYQLTVQLDSNDSFNNTDKTIQDAQSETKFIGKIADGSKVKKGDVIKLTTQNYELTHGDIVDKSGKKIASIRLVSQGQPNTRFKIENQEPGVWENTTPDNAGYQGEYEIVFEDISDLRDIEFEYKSLRRQQLSKADRRVEVPVKIKIDGKDAASKPGFISPVSMDRNVTDVKSIRNFGPNLDSTTFNLNTQTALTNIVINGLGHSGQVDNLKKGTTFEWKFNTGEFNNMITSLLNNGKQYTLDEIGKLDLANQVFENKPIGVLNVNGPYGSQVNKDGFLNNPGQPIKYKILEASGDKLKIELTEDLTAGADYVIIGQLKSIPKTIDASMIDPKTGYLLQQPTGTDHTLNAATGVDHKTENKPAIYNQGTWSNANGQAIVKTPTQLVGRIPGGKEVPISSTNPMEKDNPYSLTPPKLLTVDGKVYEVIDPAPRTGKTDPNVPKVYADYKEVLPPTTTQKADPATTVVTTSAPTTTTAATTKAPTTTEAPTTTVITTKAPTTTVVTTKAPTTTVKATTEQPTTTVVTTKTPTTTVTATTVVPKKVTTYFKDDKGNEVKSPVDGDQPKATIPGYEYVETTVDPDGNVTHVYKKVEVTSTKEVKPLPKTGDASSLIGLVGTGLASVIGLVNFKRKK